MADSPSRNRTWMVSRIDGLPRMLSQNESEARKLAEFHNAYIGDFVNRHNGTVLEAESGSLLARFDRPGEAAACCLAVRRGMAEYNEGVSAKNRFNLRMGIDTRPQSPSGREAEAAVLEILVDFAAARRICVSGRFLDACLRKPGVVSQGRKRIGDSEKEVEIFELLSLEGGEKREAPRVAVETGDGPKDPEREPWEGFSFLRRIDGSEGIEIPRDRHPEIGRKLHLFLDRLADKGVLRRKIRGTNISEYSLSHPKDLRNLRRLFEKDGRRVARDPPTESFRIMPSVIVAAVGGMVGLSIVLSVLTSWFFFPVLILAGVLIWTGGKRERWVRDGRRMRGDSPEEEPDEPLRKTRRSPAVVSEARKLRGFILLELEASPELAARVEGLLLPVLELFLTRMEAVAERGEEIERILRAMPMDGLDKDKEILQDSRQRIDDGGQKEEIDESIRQIERQRVRYEQLQKQMEGIRSRLNAALESLKRIYLDLARMKGRTASHEFPSLEDLRKESGRLSRILDDSKRRDPED